MADNPYVIRNYVVRDDREEKFDALQWRCNADPIYAPTLAEIRAHTGLAKARIKFNNKGVFYS